jgi:hypothetical protein
VLEVRPFTVGHRYKLGLAAVTGHGFTSHRNKRVLTFQYYVDGGRSIGALDRSSDGAASLHLKAGFERHADARLCLGLAALVDVEEPLKA